jgi:hypothetical protein
MYGVIRQLLETAVDGERAKDYVRRIWEIDRHNTFAHFARSAAFVVEALRRAGVEAQVEEYPADGRSRFGDFLAPKAWDVEAATLDILAPEERRLADWSAEPLTLVMGSTGTPDGGVTTELVRWPQSGTPSVKGKVVFAPPQKEAALAQGAIGIVTCHSNEKLPDSIPYINTFFAAPKVPHFHFVLSHRAGREVEALLTKGPVTVRAAVKARLYDGVMPVVTALIPGTTEEEVQVNGHLFEIGANDNASGVGLSMEIGAALARLLAEGQLPQPRRGIRLLFGLEHKGLFAFLDRRRDVARRTVAGLNLDMVGEDQFLCRCALGVNRVFESNATFVDDLIERLCEEGLPRTVRWYSRPGVMCDNLISDPTVDIPTPALIQHPEPFYHSNADTIDKVDPNILRLVGIISGTYLYFLANAGPAEGAWLAREVAVRGAARIRRDLQARLTEMAEPGSTVPGADLRRLYRRIEYLRQRELHAVRSVRRLGLHDDHAYLSSLERSIEAVCAGEVAGIKAYFTQGLNVRLGPVRSPRPGAVEEEAARLRPRRKTFGLVTFEGLPPDVAAESQWGAIYYGEAQALFFADGRRSVLDVFNLAGEENRMGKVTLERLIAYFKFLEKLGHVEFV